jgi:hypothetical protein
MDVAGCDNAVLDSLVARVRGGIEHILKIDNGLCVSISNARATVFESAGDDILGRQVKGLDLLCSDLRDLPILAELAVDVTPRGSNRKSRGAGQKMEEWFFFDGVDIGGAGLAVNERIIGSADILSDPAVASFFVPQLAVSRTKLALYFPVGKLFVIPRFHAGKVGCFLEGYEIAKKAAGLGAQKQA